MGKIRIAFGWLFVPLSIMAGPSRIVGLSANSTNGGTVLSWTAPTNSGVATLAIMDVRYSTSPINALNWASKTRVVWLTDPGPPGTVQTATVIGLTPNTTYYFAIKVQDSAGSWSTMSMTMVSAGDSTYKVTLAWDPSPDASVVNYHIYVGTVKGTYSVTTNSMGNVSSGTVTGLAWGVTYYYVVTASNSAGLESEYSNEVEHSRP